MIICMLIGACSLGLIMLIFSCMAGVMDSEIWIDIVAGVFIGALGGAFLAALVGV